jgi:hypothetical protein
MSSLMVMATACSRRHLLDGKPRATMSRGDLILDALQGVFAAW